MKSSQQLLDVLLLGSFNDTTVCGVLLNTTEMFPLWGSQRETQGAACFTYAHDVDPTLSVHHHCDVITLAIPENHCALAIKSDSPNS